MPKASPYRQDNINDNDGTWIAPQQDGSNRFRDCTSCAIVMSAKAQDHKAIFEKLHPNATKTAISLAREGPLIFQFVTRGAIREATYRGDYAIYLYDRQQAEALRDRLQAYGYLQVALEHIALDEFADRTWETKARKPSYATPAERQEARRHQTEKDNNATAKKNGRKLKLGALGKANSKRNSNQLTVRLRPTAAVATNIRNPPGRRAPCRGDHMTILSMVSVVEGLNQVVPGCVSLFPREVTFNHKTRVQT